MFPLSQLGKICSQLKEPVCCPLRTVTADTVYKIKRFQGNYMHILKIFSRYFQDILKIFERIVVLHLKSNDFF